jgi:hypothetical protein
LLYSRKQFCSRFVALVEKSSRFETTPERCFHKNQNINLFGIHCLYLWCSQNVVFLQSKRNRDFCQSCLLVRFLVNTATLEKTVGFLSFSVIVILVRSRDGLVEQLLWSFVIAPLPSYCLNFCKGTITVIVWNQNTVAMQCLHSG